MRILNLGHYIFKFRIQGNSVDVYLTAFVGKKILEKGGLIIN